MSHFTVLVVGEDVEKSLAPFHEFECTGRNDEFVQSIDKTVETMETYGKHTIRKLRSPSGDLYDPYDARFLREPTPEEEKENCLGLSFGPKGRISDCRDWQDGRGYRMKIKFVPEGYGEIDIPASEVMSISEFIDYYYGDSVIEGDAEPDLEEEHKYGWGRIDYKGELVEHVKRTNPNAKWDWYQVGGRWTGFFKLKNGRTGEVGNPGLMTEIAPSGYADSALKRDIDFQGMRDEAGDKAAARYDKVHAILSKHPKVEDWDAFSARFTEVEKAREAFWGQPGIKALGQSKDEEVRWVALDSIADYLKSRDEYIQQARDNALSTFAVLLDGNWYERGSMGWWGIVSNEEDRGGWKRKISDLVETLPDHARLTVVDCHI